MRHFLALLFIGLLSCLFVGTIMGAGNPGGGVLFIAIGWPAVLVSSIAGGLYCESLTRKRHD